MFFKFVLFDNHWIDTQAGCELDVVDRLQVGRIRDAKEQALPTLDQRQYPVFGDQLGVNSTHDVEIQLDGIEIE